MDNKNVFAKNLNRFLSLTGKSRKEVCEDLGFSYYTFSDWCIGRKYPRMDKVEMLADYFGVKKSDLIEEKPAPINGNGLSEKKRDFIDRVMQMSEAELDRLEAILALVEQ